MAAAEEKGAFSYQPQKPDGDEDDDFVEAPQSQQTSTVRHDCLFSRQTDVMAVILHVQSGQA